MRIYRAIPVAIVCLLVAWNINADTITPADEAQAEPADIQSLKTQLYNNLTAGDIKSSSFDIQSEQQIAATQIAMAKYYLSAGDRKNAAISALLARKLLQNIYGSPEDPRLIPVYSLLVSIYESDVDTDAPNTQVADASQAKLYRELIDQIHAQ